MKKIATWLCKAVLAGVLALVIASAVCMVYYNQAVRVTNETGVTDYVWENNRFICSMNEGIAWRKTDKNGFIRSSGVDYGMEILLMGSSHMEAKNVLEHQDIAALLMQSMGCEVYNIGISGHTLLHCVKNLEAALDTMAPTKYVVIETSSTSFSPQAIQRCINGEMQSIASYDKGLVYYLQQIKYLRLAYAQLSAWMPDHDEDTVAKQEAPRARGTSGNEEGKIAEAYDALAQYIHHLCTARGVQPVIFFHPTLSIDSNGTASAVMDENTLKILANSCAKYSIIFVDMSQPFLEMYSQEYKLPHGFCNTAVGVGHLNRYGHQSIANHLVEVLTAYENAEVDGT